MLLLRPPNPYDRDVQPDEYLRWELNHLRSLFPGFDQWMRDDEQQCQ